ncbi:Anr2p RNJ42_00909 [Nakaseomyces bracarensis]|uniref:Anr2p n=1 Tax=Nakaseomyces bracarensis TaxID=273131 RepID=UPI00387203A6
MSNRELLELVPNESEIPLSLTSAFLCQFDMKRGNIIAWSAGENNEILKGIEFKALPSGIHEATDDIIRFTLNHNGTLYYGLCCYVQNSFEVLNEDGQVDRSRVKMYSLGVLVDASKIKYKDKLKLYEITNYFIDPIEEVLLEWMKLNLTNDFSLLEEFYKNYKKSDNLQKNPARSMVKCLPYWLRKLGPLIFPVLKSCLLRERLLILAAPGNSFEYTNSLIYCLAALSKCPLPMVTTSETQMDYNNSFEDQSTYCQALFTVGTYDIDTLHHYKESGYIAVSSDEVLVYKEELYDKVLDLPSDSLIHEGLSFRDNTGKHIKATQHEAKLFEKLIATYFDEEISSIESARFATYTESMSWLQFLLDGIYFFTTAGYVSASYNQIPDIKRSSIQRENEEDDAFQVRATVLFFQERTEKLHKSLKGYIENDSLSISRSNFTGLDLDCFSSQDDEFLIQISEKWFNKRINTNSYIKGFC